MIIRLCDEQHTFLYDRFPNPHSVDHVLSMLYWYFYWPDEEPGVGPQPGQSEEKGEAEGERDPGAGRRGGEGPGEWDCPGEVGDQQHLDQQEDAGAA